MKVLLILAAALSLSLSACVSPRRPSFIEVHRTPLWQRILYPPDDA